MKKKVPLQVLEVIEPFVNRKGTSFESIDPKDFLLHFIDKDKSSDFYFRVEGYKNENKFILLIDRKPFEKMSVSNKKNWIEARDLENQFTEWLNLLDGYEKVKSVFDDPIINAYAEEYISEFEIIDDDADIMPFSVKQVFFLDKHLDEVGKKIKKYQTPENKDEIEEIKNSILLLRENLTKKSKTWVVRHLSIIYARITKQDPKILKEILSEAKKLAIKEGVKYGFDKISEIGGSIISQISN